MRKLAAFIADNDRDLMLVLGLALVGAGLWPLSREAALAAPGAVLILVAVFGVRG